MKLFLNTLLLLMALTVCNAVSAQSKLSEEQKKELAAKFESYKEKLNLTEQQQEKVKTINTTYFEELEELKKSGGSRMSKMKTFRRLSDERDKQMKGVLDEKQYETYKTMQKEMKKELKDKRNS